MPATAALGNYTIRVQSGDAQGAAAFEVQEYRKPEFEVIVQPASRFGCKAREAVVSVQARYYFGQPVANAQLRWVVNKQPYYSPLRWDDGFEGEESNYWYGGDQTAEGTLRLDAAGKARAADSARRWMTNGRDLQRAHRSASHRRGQSRGVGQHRGARHLRHVPGVGANHELGIPCQQSRRDLDSRDRLTGAPQPNVPVTLDARASRVPRRLLHGADRDDPGDRAQADH